MIVVRSGRVLSISLLALGAMSAAPRVRAEAPSAAGTAPPAIQVGVIGDAPPGLETRVLSWFSQESRTSAEPRQARLSAATVLQPTGIAGVRLWIVVAPERARLYFSVEEGADKPPRYLLSDVVLDHGLDELDLERVAQVAFLSASALWEGRLQTARVEVERDLDQAPAVESEPPEPTPAPPARPPSRAAAPARRGSHWLFRTGLEYGARLRGPERLAHGPGAFIAVSLPDGELAWGGRVHAQLLWPQAPESRGFELDVRGYTLRAGPWLATRLSESFWASAELGGGVDWISYETAATDTGYRADPGDTEIRPLLFAAAGVHFELGSARVGLVGLLALQLFDTQYQVGTESAATVLLAPWRVQPGLALEIGW